MATSHLKQAPAAEPAARHPTAESLGRQLREALPPLRLHSVSLYDRAGEVLWLSEGALGPDEHAFVLEALRTLSAGPSVAHSEADFDDGRGAVFLAVRSPHAELVGLVMILADAKALAARGLVARILSPPVRAVLQRLAILLRPRSGGAEPSVSGTSRTLEILEWSPPGPAATAELPAPAELSRTAELQPPAMTTASAAETSADTEAVLTAQAVDRMLTLELEGGASSAPDAEVSRAAGADPDPVRAPTHAPTTASMLVENELYIHELTKLRPGGRTRRLRLVPPQAPIARDGETPSGQGGATAGSAVAERTLLAPLRGLAAWLDAHPALAEGAALSFSIPVSQAALAVDELPAMVEECIRSTRIAPASIGLEIQEAACVKEHERAGRLIEALERIGAFLVLDDFRFDSAALELLRSRALRLVKVDRSLIRASLRDKLAQARIVAVSQAARVLGIHCAAKHVESIAIQRWLAAAGFDFAEGPLLGGPRPLESLAEECADA